MKTFSVNAAAELLERDRRTLVRALRHVLPDAHEGRHPRWRMPTILAALETNNTRPERHDWNNRTELDDELAAAWAQFDAAYEKMKAEPSLAKRREMSIKLGPLILETDRMFRSRNALAGEDAELTTLKGDKILLLIARGFEGPCAWSLDQAWANLYVSDGRAAG